MAIGGFLGSALAGLTGYDRAQQEAQQNQDRQIRTRMLMQEFQQRQQQDQFKQQVLGLVGRLGGMDGLSRLMGGGAPPLQQMPQTAMPQMGGGQPDQLVPQRARPGQDMGGGLAAGGALTGGIPARGTPERERLIDTIFRTESGNRNIPQGIVPPGGGYNPSVGRVTGPSTASGPGQITDSTLRDVQKTDPALAGYSRAMDMPIALQRRATDDLIDKRGVQPWAPYNAKLREELAKDPQLMQGSQAVGKQVAQSIPPMAQGKMGLQQLAQMINEAAPDASDAVKGAALIQLHELLAPYEKMQFQQQLKEQMGTGSHYFETPQGPVRVPAGSNVAEPVQLPPGYKPKNTEEGKGWTTMEMTMPDGTKQPVRVHASDGKVEPLQLPGGGKGLTKVGGDASQRGGPAAMITRRYLEAHPDATDEDLIGLQGKLSRERSIQTAFAGGTAATQVRSLNTIADHIELAREYGEAMRNNDLPKANAALNAWAMNTGHPEVVDFNAARTIMADEVVRLLTSTGGTEQDRKDMQSIFDVNASPEQMQGAMNVATRFVSGRLGALQQQYARNDPKRQAEFQSDMLSPGARKVFGAKVPTATEKQTRPVEGAAATPAAPAAPAKGGVIKLDADGNVIP